MALRKENEMMSKQMTKFFCENDWTFYRSCAQLAIAGRHQMKVLTLKLFGKYLDFRRLFRYFKVDRMHLHHLLLELLQGPHV